MFILQVTTDIKYLKDRFNNINTKEKKRKNEWNVPGEMADSKTKAQKIDEGRAWVAQSLSVCLRLRS